MKLEFICLFVNKPIITIKLKKTEVQPEVFKMLYHIHFLDAGKRCNRNTNLDFNWVSFRKKKKKKNENDRNKFYVLQ